jgi:hypothetical protein
VTDENVFRILKEKTDLETELECLIGTSLEQIWLQELLDLEKKYDMYQISRQKLQEGTEKGEKKKMVITKKVVAGGGSKK